MKFIYFVIIILLFSCTGEKNVKISRVSLKKELQVQEFFQKNLILNDSKIIGYFNPQNFLKNNVLNDKILTYNKVFKNISYFKPFFFTVSDYDKKQEIIFFFFQKLNFLINKNDIIKKEKIENYKLLNLYNTYNQKFSYLELKGNSIYGDCNLIKDLFKIKNDTKKPISEKLHKKIIKYFKNNNNSILRLLSIKDNNNLFKFIFQKLNLEGELLNNIPFIFLDIYSKDKNIVLKLDIEFKDNYPNYLYELLNNNFKYLVTDFKYNKENILKKIKIEKKNKNIIIKLNINKFLLKSFIQEELK